MSKLIDLTNQKFGRWQVLSRAKNTSDGRAQWLCHCECGTERIVLGKTLRSGKSTSCGCSKFGKGRVDLTNKKFGKLTVIEQAPNKSTGRTAWVCQCDCGNMVVVGTKELQNGDTQSCGCLREELIIKNEIGKKYGRLTVLERIEQVFPDGAYWKCKCDCGNIIITSGRRLRSGHTMSCGCLVSKGEALLKSILTDNNINFIQQYTFEDCLTENGNQCKFDFAIFDEYNKLKCLIEYDGIQHFEETNWNLEQNQLRDKIKDKYCLLNNIPLIRIPYTDYNKMDINYLKERIDEECTMVSLLK